jgi:hypothetical protein
MKWEDAKLAIENIYGNQELFIRLVDGTVLKFLGKKISGCGGTKNLMGFDERGYKVYIDTQKIEYIAIKPRG